MFKLAVVLAIAVLTPLAVHAPPRLPVAIRSCSYTIAAPGSYVLAQDLVCPGDDAITITADNVRLPLGGHTLTGNTGRGVFAGKSDQGA